MTPFYHRLADTRHRIPDAERSRSQQPVVHGSEQVAPPPKEVLYDPVHRQDALRVSDRFESSHLALALPCRLMRDLGSVVLVLPGAMHNSRHDGSVRRPVAAELVRD